MVGNRGFADYERTGSSSGPEVPLEENAPAVTDDRRREADFPLLIGSTWITFRLSTNRELRSGTDCGIHFVRRTINVAAVAK